MSDLDIFGRVVLAAQVERNIRDHLYVPGPPATGWLKDYLPMVCRANGWAADALQLPRSFERVNDFTKLPDAALPCLLVVNPGISAQPTRRGGTYTGSWQVSIVIVASVAGVARDQAREVAQVYAGAVRLALIEQGAVTDLIHVAALIDEGYDDVPDSARRTLAAGRVVIEVEGGILGDTEAGPIAPASDPLVVPPAPPTITTVSNADVVVPARR